MQYAQLGTTGLIVSRIALGSMTFGDPVGPGAAVKKVDQAMADRIVAQAIDAGVTYFNTADQYGGGQSEEMLGKALGGRRDEVILATKVGNRVGSALMDHGLSRRHLLSGVVASLRRLGTDYIDVYLAHVTDRSTPMEETLETFDLLVREGKVRYVGFSNWPTWMASRAVGMQTARGWTRFSASEMYYSLLCRDLEHEFVPFAVDAGVGLTIWSPLSMGLLSGRYTAADPTGAGGRLADTDFIVADRDQAYRVVECLRSIAADHNATVAQVALAWILAKPHVASAIVGVSSASQLEDNTGSADVQLSSDALTTLDELTAPPKLYPEWLPDNDPAYEAIGL